MQWLPLQTVRRLALSSLLLSSAMGLPSIRKERFSSFLQCALARLDMELDTMEEISRLSDRETQLYTLSAASLTGVSFDDQHMG